MTRPDEYDLTRRCFGAISLALHWIVAQLPSKETRFKYYCDDITGTSFVLSSLARFFRERYAVFNSILWEKRAENKPLESVDNFIRDFEDPLEFENYVDIYLDVLSPRSGVSLVPHRYRNRHLEAVIRGCIGCENQFSCLYAFVEFLFYLQPESYAERNTLNFRILKKHQSDITKILEKNLIKPKKRIDELEKGTGWSHSVRDRENVDAYVTARMLQFFQTWPDKILEEDFRFKKDFSKDSEIFQRCLETVRQLQVAEDKVQKYNIANEKNVKGAWREVAWGNTEVWRVMGASQISKILYGIERKRSTEMDRTKMFIENTYIDGSYNMDVTIFSDGYTATISDITGTIGALDFYLSLGKEFDIAPDSDLVLRRLEWLLAQQRADGAWPVLSERFWRKERKKKDSEIVKKRLLGDQNSNNISLRNTLLMLNILIDFPKQLLGTR